MRLQKVLLSLCMMIFSIVILSGCSDIQKEYYEVHVIVVESQPFYFIDPSDGKDTLSVRYMGDGETQFIYLYEQVDGVEFSYTHFFTNIESHYVEKDTRNDKLYILSSSEIDQLITQYFIDRDLWEATHTN